MCGKNQRHGCRATRGLKACLLILKKGAPYYGFSCIATFDYPLPLFELPLPPPMKFKKYWIKGTDFLKACLHNLGDGCVFFLFFLFWIMMMCVAYYCYIIPQDKENTVSPMQVNYSLFIELTQLRPGAMGGQ